MNQEDLSFIRILGMNEHGQKYLNVQKKQTTINTTIERKSKIHQYELQASIIYDMIMKTNTYLFEIKGSPILFSSKESK